MKVARQTKEASELYRWFLPLLRMDTVPKSVQVSKLVQQELGVGNPRVRLPRMEVLEEELGAAQRVIREARQNRPQRASSSFTGGKV